MKNIAFFNWGLGIGDWGLGIGDWAQSPIPNPQSPWNKSIFNYHLILKQIKLNINYLKKLKLITKCQKSNPKQNVARKYLQPN